MESVQLSRTDSCNDFLPAPEGERPQWRAESNREVIDEMMALYGGMVFRIGILYLRNKEDAQDVFQEVFIKLFSSKKEFESEENRKAWLVTVTVNQCKNILRSVWRKRVVAIDELCAQAEDECGAQESSLVMELLKLPLKYRRVIFLYYYEGYKSEEIANLLHISPATVRTQLKRGREMLKGILTEDQAL